MPQPMKMDPVEAERMWHEGVMVKDIAAAFDVTPACVSRFARVIGLPSRYMGGKRRAS